MALRWISLDLTDDKWKLLQVMATFGYAHISELNHVLLSSLYWGMVGNLTHWGRDKMADISQTTLSNPFSLMKIFEFRLKFHWSLFQRFQLTIFQHWFRLWLGADQATSHYLNQYRVDHWRIYASLGLNELTLLYSKYCWNIMTIHGQNAHLANTGIAARLHKLYWAIFNFVLLEINDREKFEKKCICNSKSALQLLMTKHC